MKGIILAGGNGTRLHPLTRVANKHLLPVYDQPMIYYPIQTLKDMGCDEIIIVSGGEHIGGFANVLQDGSEFGVRFTYRIQPEAGGIGQALACAEGLINGLFPVILGDNYFDVAPTLPDHPTIYEKKVPDPQRFGIYQDGLVVEKPLHPKNDKAIIGLYVYDDRVFDYIRSIKPSERGEIEITDISNCYFREDAMAVVNYSNYWSDMGTFDSLNEAANFVRELK